MLIKRSDLNKIIAGYLRESLSDEIDSNWLPFSSEERGNLFRDWVNDNKSAEEIAELYPGKSDKTLGRTGSADNEYVEKAWEAFGDEFIEDPAVERKRRRKERRRKRREIEVDSEPATDKKESYVILGNVPTSGVIRSAVSKFIESKDQIAFIDVSTEDQEEDLMKTFDKIPQGHGFTILVSADGVATGVDFGAYAKGPCYRAGVDPALLQFNIESSRLGPVDEFVTSTFLKEKSNRAEFKEWLRNNLDLRAIRKLDPKSRRQRRADGDTEAQRNARLLRFVNGLDGDGLEKVFFKTSVKFFTDRGLSDLPGDPSMRTLKKQKSLVARTAAGMFSPGSVLVFPLGTVDLSQGMTTRIAESLLQKYKQKFNRALEGSQPLKADYAVFNAKNVDGALEFVNKRECRLYVVFPNGPLKRFRLTDNCGTFAYRVYSRAMGRGGGIPMALFNAPSKLLVAGVEAGREEMLFTGKVR